jgi:hypothetical protein
MASQNMVMLRLESTYGKSVTQQIWQDLPFMPVLELYSQKFDVKKWAAWFFYQNRDVDWILTPDNIGLDKGGLIIGLNVSLFFEESKMWWIDQWNVFLLESGLCNGVNMEEVYLWEERTGSTTYCQVTHGQKVNFDFHIAM